MTGLDVNCGGIDVYLTLYVHLVLQRWGCDDELSDRGLMFFPSAFVLMLSAAPTKELEVRISKYLYRPFVNKPQVASGTRGDGLRRK